MFAVIDCPGLIAFEAFSDSEKVVEEIANLCYQHNIYCGLYGLIDHIWSNLN